MQLRALPPLIYKRKLEGKWKHWSLNDLVKEVERRYAAGIPLPPDNTIPPPLEKKTVAQQNAEIVNASIPLSSSS
jgi:hypothetical protein